MSFPTFSATSASRAASPAVVNRRLVGGLVLSLVLHALLLTLQFGVPGLGLPSPFQPPVSMTVMLPAPPLPAVLAPSPENGAPLLPAPVSPKPELAKPAKAAKPRRVSRPMPPRAPEPTPTRVIARDQNANDSFVVPPQPQAQLQSPPQPQAEAALQKTDDLQPVQAGSDDGADVQAQEAQQAEKDSRRQAELVARDASSAFEQQRIEQQRIEQPQIEQQRIAQARQRADEQARAQQADLAAAKQQVDERALKQKAEEVALRQKADEQAARLRADDLARQQAAEAAAAGQRERERSAAAAAGKPDIGNGGSGATVPKNLLGSDAGNRVRELTRGIDLLHGAPPRGARDDERGARRAVVGSGERDVPLRMYVDSFRQKVERNGGQGFTSHAGDRAGTDPLVSVALRSDGSVDDVTIVRSSGNADTDNAVRRIIRLNARYSAFPPNIADRYDVIEVRRIWRFAEALRLLEELR